MYPPVDTDEVRTGVFVSDTGAIPGQSLVSVDGEVWTDIGVDGSSNLRIRAHTVERLGFI